MQTFLPYKDFRASAQCLDDLRLGKQRLEVLEILVILDDRQPPWMSDQWWARCQSHRNHPAVKMWRGYEQALAWYGLCVCHEWASRGYVCRIHNKIREYYTGEEYVKPPWLTDRFCRSHQSNLRRKRPDLYEFDVPPYLPYVWPCK